MLVTTPALAMWGAGAGLLALGLAAFLSYVAQVSALGRLRDRLYTTALTAETAGLFGRRELAAMRPGAFIVNTARGKGL